jgi:hypothetical protein
MVELFTLEGNSLNSFMSERLAVKDRKISLLFAVSLHQKSTPFYTVRMSIPFFSCRTRSDALFEHTASRTKACQDTVQSMA